MNWKSTFYRGQAVEKWVFLPLVVHKYYTDTIMSIVHQRLTYMRLHSFSYLPAPPINGIFSKLNYTARIQYRRSNTQMQIHNHYTRRETG